MGDKITWYEKLIIIESLKLNLRTNPPEFIKNELEKIINKLEVQADE